EEAATADPDPAGPTRAEAEQGRHRTPEGGRGRYPDQPATGRPRGAAQEAGGRAGRARQEEGRRRSVEVRGTAEAGRPAEGGGEGALRPSEPARRSEVRTRKEEGGGCQARCRGGPPQGRGLEAAGEARRLVRPGTGHRDPRSRRQGFPRSR